MKNLFLAVLLLFSVSPALAINIQIDEEYPVVFEGQMDKSGISDVFYQLDYDKQCGPHITDCLNQNIIPIKKIKRLKLSGDRPILYLFNRNGTLVSKIAITLDEWRTIHSAVKLKCPATVTIPRDHDQLSINLHCKILSSDI